jgi:hypothetical protein
MISSVKLGILWLIGFPLVIYTVWYGNAVYQEYNSPWIPTRTFPHRPDLGFYIGEYFFMMLFIWFVLPQVTQNPLFFPAVTVWFGGLIMILYKKEINVFLRRRLGRLRSQ